MSRSRRQPQREPKREPAEHQPPRWLRHADDLFPVLARYIGLLLIGYSIFGDHLKHASLLTAAIGLTVLKALWGAARGDRD